MNVCFCSGTDQPVAGTLSSARQGAEPYIEAAGFSPRIHDSTLVCATTTYHHCGPLLKVDCCILRLELLTPYVTDDTFCISLDSDLLLLLRILLDIVMRLLSDTLSGSPNSITMHASDSLLAGVVSAL